MDTNSSGTGGSRIVAVYFTDPETYGYPLNKEYYRTAYEELAEELRARGARLFVVRGKGTHLGGNRFSRAWEYVDGECKEHAGELTADIVYDKGSDFVPDAGTVTLNDPAMDAVCTDKSKTHELFEQCCPVTTVVRSANDVDAALASIPSDRIVCKPLDGEEGRGVFVIEKSETKAAIPSYPYLLQEFLDLSAGIPGLVDSIHDLRIIGINGEVVLCFIRTPPPDSFLANVAQGGTKIEVPLDKIPDGAMDIWKTVDAEFSKYRRRAYSVDLGRTRDGIWKIIELNAKPGCTNRAEGQNSARFLAALAEALVL